MTAKSMTMHGVFLCVSELGVLLTGPSGIGKSELGLSLISRGHSLIADDAVEFHLNSHNQLIGHCPEILQDFLEVRGLGPLNIRAMFGDNAIEKAYPLHLIIYVNKLSDKELVDIDRLHGLYRTFDILGCTIPEVTVPVSAGRELLFLVEAAVLNQKLKSKGYDASEAFVKRQEHFLQKGSSS